MMHKSVDFSVLQKKASIMQFLVVISCLLAVACAKPSGVPLAYSGIIPSSYGYSYSSHVAAPAVAYSAAHVAPLAYSAYSPVAHSAYVAPSVHSAVVGPSVHSTVVGPSVHSAVVGPSVVARSVVAPAVHSAVVAPVAHSAVVAHQAAVVGVEKTQYHAQDTLGQAAYGHSEAFQAHNAVQDAAGNKIGSYSYVAPNGQVIAANYVADALGYRVASNANPVESADIVAARAAHLAEVEVVRHRNRRSPVFAAYSSPLAYHSAPVSTLHGGVIASGYSAPLVAAPHSYSYRYY